MECHEFNDLATAQSFRPHNRIRGCKAIRRFRAPFFHVLGQFLTITGGNVSRKPNLAARNDGKERASLPLIMFNSVEAGG